MIARVHNIACVNCSTGTYFFLKQTEVPVEEPKNFFNASGYYRWVLVNFIFFSLLIYSFLGLINFLLFGCPTTNFGLFSRGSLTNLMLITALYLCWPEGHWEPCNKVGSLSPAKRLVGFLMQKGLLQMCCKFSGVYLFMGMVSVKLQSGFVEILLLHFCSLVGLFHVCRASLLESNSGELLLNKDNFYIWFLIYSF